MAHLQQAGSFTLKSCTLPGGTSLTLRTVRPQDDLPLLTLVTGLSAQARRNRFLGNISFNLGHARQMSQVDGHRHVALVVSALIEGREQLVADARYVIDESGQSAEFAVMVAEGWRRVGIGSWAMRALQQSATHAGLTALRGEVMLHNQPMLALMSQCGYEQRASGEGGHICLFEKHIAPQRPTTMPWVPAWIARWASLRQHRNA